MFELSKCRTHHTARRAAVAAAALAALAVLSLTGAQAAPVTIPTGLAPGTQYRLAFLTTYIMDPSSPDIADYNAFVTSEANVSPELLALGTTWTAIASSETVSARENTNTDFTTDVGVGIYLLNDTKLADNNADLWDGTIQNSLSIDRTGAADSTGIDFVWTGTQTNGLPDEPETALAGSGTINGNWNFADFRWIEADTFQSYPFDENGAHFYAISGFLTIPEEQATAVAEPTALSVLALGLIGLGAIRRRRAV